jgi:hypothetical protein
MEELKQAISDLQRKNGILQSVNDHLVFQTSVQGQKIDSFQREKDLVREEEKKKRGVHLSINSNDDRIAWFRTKDEKLHQKLWSELSSFIQINHSSTSVKHDEDMLLDLLFFNFFNRFFI